MNILELLLQEDSLERTSTARQLINRFRLQGQEQKATRVENWFGLPTENLASSNDLFAKPGLPLRLSVQQETLAHYFEVYEQEAAQAFAQTTGGLLCGWYSDGTKTWLEGGERLPNGMLAYAVLPAFWQSRMIVIIDDSVDATMKVGEPDSQGDWSSILATNE